MEIIWGLTLPFPQEYPEEPQRFHNLKPCVIMSYILHTQTSSAWSNEEAEQGLWASVTLWSDPCQMSPAQGFTQKLSDTPQASRISSNHPAFTTLPVHPAPPTSDCSFLKRSSSSAWQRFYGLPALPVASKLIKRSEHPSSSDSRLQGNPYW